MAEVTRLVVNKVHTLLLKDYITLFQETEGGIVSSPEDSPIKNEHLDSVDSNLELDVPNRLSAKTLPEISAGDSIGLSNLTH